MMSESKQAAEIDGIGMALIDAERQRQIDIEGYTPEHDAEHGRHILAQAARVYAAASWRQDQPGEFWPWDRAAFKPRDRVSNLIRAGALYKAALDLPDPVEAFWADERTEILGPRLASVAEELDAILAAVQRVTSTD